MEPLDVALENYAEFSPQRYLEGTHDAAIYDIAFDGETLMLASESWVATDPVQPEPGRNFRVIFSRYRASFVGVSDFRLVTTDSEEFPGEATLGDMMKEEIRTIELAPPTLLIETDAHELRLRFKTMKIERFKPSANSEELR